MDVKNLNSSMAPRSGSDSDLAALARGIVDLQLAPSASITVSVRRSDGWYRTTATAGFTRSGALTPNTPYDLASLTKPIVAVTASKLADLGELGLSDRISRWLPEARHLPVADASLEHLLSHRAGLLGHRVLFNRLIQHRALSQSAMLLAAADSLRPDCRGTGSDAHSRAVYSDLGYLIVGEVLKRATGLALDSLVSQLLLEPMGVPIGSSRQWSRTVVGFRELVAPTENVSWRGGILRGTVHDENAWAWAGLGMAGHAGLFGTSPGVALFGEAMIDALAGRTGHIPRFSALFCTGQREGGTLRAGFDGVSTVRSSAGVRMSRLSFGHLGFTGTSIWCDPENEYVFAMLTNRVCPSRSDSRLPTARGEIHDRLFEWAERFAQRP